MAPTADSIRDGFVETDEVIVVTRQRSLCQRLRTTVTVEIVAFLYFAGYVSYLPTLQQYVYAQIGMQHGLVPLAKSDNDCSHNTSSAVEDLVQEEASLFMMTINAVRLPTGFVMTLFLGRYSDRKGRRIALILPILGAVAMTFISLLVVYFRWNLYLLLAAAILDSLSGGVMSVVMACFAYISDVSPEATRSFRIIVVEVSLSAGIATSTLGTGYVIREFGYGYSFLFGMGAFSLNAIITLLYIKETIIPEDDVRFISLKHISESVKLFAKDNGQRRRWKLIILLAIMCLTCIVDIGSSDVTTYFMLDQPLCFSSVLIGYYQAATYLAKGVGCIVLQRVLRSCVPDTGFIILSSVANIAMQMLLAFSTTRIMIFSVPVIAAATALVVPLVRAVSSKLVMPTELGMLFAALAFSQQLGSFLGGIFLDLIYARTVTLFAGTAFVTSAGIILVTLLLATILYVGMRNQQRQNVQYGPIN